MIVLDLTDVLTAEDAESLKSVCQAQEELAVAVRDTRVLNPKNGIQVPLDVYQKMGVWGFGHINIC